METMVVTNKKINLDNLAEFTGLELEVIRRILQKREKIELSFTAMKEADEGYEEAKGQYLMVNPPALESAEAEMNALFNTDDESDEEIGCMYRLALRFTEEPETAQTEEATA